MKTINITATIELEYQVEDWEEVDDDRVDDIIAHQIEGEVIAEVQNNCNWYCED